MVEGQRALAQARDQRDVVGGDKQGYPDAFDLAIPRLKKGGIFITDNVLWSGRVLSDGPDETTKAIQKFNKKLFNTDGILSSIIPIRDGLGIAVKQ